jgi:uncharacterized protein (DUF1778 family)
MTEKQKLSERIEIRVSQYEKNLITGLAKMYAKGNISLFLVYSAFNADRKMLDENDLRESNRSVRKGRHKDGQNPREVT